MRKLFAIAALCLSAFAQEQDPAVSISGGPPIKSWTSQIFYTTISSADYIEYICYARTPQKSAALSITQIVDSGTTATVTTSVAHGYSVGNQIIIAGVTVDTDLNGTYAIATVGSTTTFTVTSASVTDATYNNTGITSTSQAPRTTDPIWAIKKFFYTGTNMTAIRWAVKPGQANSTTSQANICDSRATLAYQ